MKFKIYQRITAADCRELKSVDITSMEELKSLYEEYGHEDEPVKIYFDIDHIIIEQVAQTEKITKWLTPPLKRCIIIV